MAEWLCAICGGTFLAAPSSKKVTCSRECSAIRRSKVHLGIRNRWADTSKARLAAQRTGNLAKGTPAARVSPRGGPYETNASAKDWIVIDPTGTRYRARNLRLWCETHADLFAPHPWRHAYAGLKQVAYWLSGRRKAPAPAWRGWTLKDRPRPAHRADRRS